jgi:hypothetical protein
VPEGRLLSGILQVRQRISLISARTSPFVLVPNIRVQYDGRSVRRLADRSQASTIREAKLSKPPEAQSIIGVYL